MTSLTLNFGLPTSEAGWYSASNYNGGAKTGTSIQAAINAASSAGGGVVYVGAGTWALGATGLTYPGSHIVICGAGRNTISSGGTIITYTGTGAALSNSDYTTTRWSCGLENLTIDIAGASDGARCVELWNFRRFVARTLTLTDGSYDPLTAGDRTPHSHGYGLKLIGTDTPTWYETSHNAYYDLDIVAGNTCVDIGMVCNGNRFFGGSWEGPGKAIVCNPVTYNTDTNMFLATSIATSNATVIEIGNAGGGGANNFVFLATRVESRSVGRAAFILGDDAKWTEIIGGQFGNVDITDNTAANCNWFSGCTFSPPYGYNAGSGGHFDLIGPGSPESVVVGGIGSTYRRTDGGAGTSFYVKQSGTGTTGWAAK
jgi:hypothetical protein